MRNWRRTIPRDLFNEAKLLKCLGQLYLESERFHPNKLEVTFNNGNYNGFDVCQDQSDGTLYSDNVRVFVNRKAIHVCTPYNSKLSYPLCAVLGDDEIIPVFTDGDKGGLSPEFLRLVKHGAET